MAINSEHELLGTILRDDKFMATALSYGLTELMFTDNKHKLLFGCMKRLQARHISITPVMISQTFPEETKIITLTYMMQLSGSISTVRAFEDNARHIIKRYQKIMLQDVAMMINQSKETEPDKLIEQMQQRTLDIIKLGNRERKSKDDRLAEYLERAYLMNEGKEEMKLSTGYSDLDKLLGGGFQEGNLVTMFARSGIGKTTLAVNMAHRIAQSGKRVAFYTVEMVEKEILDKIVALDSKMNYAKVQSPKGLSQDEMMNFSRAIGRLSPTLELHDDIGSAEELINSIMFEAMSGELDVVFVDYLQLFGEGLQGNSLSEKMGDLTINLKKIAQMYKITVIALAQANRQYDNRNEKVDAENNEAFYLKRGDIQDSARIEQNSNIILGLIRNLRLDDDEVRRELEYENTINLNSKYLSENPELLICQVIKNRSGKVGKVALRYQGKYSLIDDFKEVKA